MCLKFKVTVFIFWCFFYGVCQTNSKDTMEVQLKNIIASTKNDSIKVNAYIKLGNHFLSNNFSKSEKYFNQAKQVLTTSSTLLNSQKANVFAQLGVIYKRKGDYPLAMEYYLKSKHIFDQLKDYSSASSVLHNIAMIYRDQREYRKAVKTFKEVIEEKNKLKEAVGVGIAYNMMGVVYRKLQQLDSAALCYTKAKAIFIEERSDKNIPRVNSNLAALLHYQKQYNKAIELHKKNIVYYTKYNKQTSLFSSHFNIAKTYLIKKQFKEASKHIDTAIVIAKKMGLKEKLARAYLRKSVVYSDQGDYKNALVYHKMHKKYTDSVYNKKNTKKLQKLELTYKFKKEKLRDSLRYTNEKRILKFQKREEANKKWLYFSLFIITILLGVIVTYLFKKYYKNKTQKVKVEFYQKEKELQEYIRQLLNKIDTQETQLQHNLKQAEVGDKTRNLHDKIAAKILTQEDWYNFKEKFNQVYPLFFESIKEKDIHLTKSEQRLVSLEKLGLDNNQIAKVLGISVDSVFVNRYRLRKKIKAPNTISIIEFLEG